MILINHSLSTLVGPTNRRDYAGNIGAFHVLKSTCTCQATTGPAHLNFPACFAFFLEATSFFSSWWLGWNPGSASSADGSTPAPLGAGAGGRNIPPRVTIAWRHDGVAAHCTLPVSRISMPGFCEADAPARYCCSESEVRANETGRDLT